MQTFPAWIGFGFCFVIVFVFSTASWWNHKESKGSDIPAAFAAVSNRFSNCNFLKPKLLRTSTSSGVFVPRNLLTSLFVASWTILDLGGLEIHQILPCSRRI
jgi:hypothetical protein